MHFPHSISGYLKSVRLSLNLSVISMWIIIGRLKRWHFILKYSYFTFTFFIAPEALLQGHSEGRCYHWPLLKINLPLFGFINTRLLIAADFTYMLEERSFSKQFILRSE